MQGKYEKKSKKSQNGSKKRICEQNVYIYVVYI